MFDYYTRIQGVIRSGDTAQVKAQAFLDILTEIKNSYGAKIGLDAQGNFYSTDPADTKAGEVAEHLKEAMAADLTVKENFRKYFQDEQDLTVPLITNLFVGSAIAGKGQNYDKSIIPRLYKNWVLQNKSQSEVMDWDKMVGDSFLDQTDAVSSGMTSIEQDGTKAIYGNNNQYDINHLLTDQEVRALTWNKLAKENNISLKEAIRDHYVGILGDDQLAASNLVTKEQYQNTMLEALANVKKTGKPSFISVCKDSHWTTVSIIPNPSKPGEVAMTYMDSLTTGGGAKKVAEDLKQLIDSNKALDFTVNPTQTQNLSTYQQVGQCCGLAAAMNNASIVRFHSAISSIQLADPTNKIDMGVMLQSFKEVESSYLFKPEIASGVGTVDKNAQTREYVRQAGQKEFDDLKKMVDHFKNKSISRGQLLDKFDTDNVRPRGFDSGKAQSYQIELSTAYTQVLTSKKGKSSAVSSHQSSKQRQDLVDRLASDIGENMSRKIFTGHYNQENKEAIVNHLKEYILPTLSDKELSQSTQNVEQIVGRVVHLNDSGWARKLVQERGQEGLAQYYSDHAMSPSGSDNLSQKKLSQLEPNKINSIISHVLSPSQSQIMSKL